MRICRPNRTTPHELRTTQQRLCCQHPGQSASAARHASGVPAVRPPLLQPRGGPRRPSPGGEFPPAASMTRGRAHPQHTDRERRGWIAAGTGGACGSGAGSGDATPLTLPRDRTAAKRRPRTRDTPGGVDAPATRVDASTCSLQHGEDGAVAPGGSAMPRCVAVHVRGSEVDVDAQRSHQHADGVDVAKGCRHHERQPTVAGLR